MLCHQYKCIFVHVPKTAGQSIELFFLGLLGLSWETRAALLLRPNDDPRLGPPRLAHLKAAEYVACGHVTQQQFDTYFKFSFVRNPWDRIVSEYKYRGYARSFDFKTYLFKHLPEKGWTDRYCHSIPQYDFLFDAEGKLLVDFVGKFESLEYDFNNVCCRLGILQTSLPHMNKSPDKNYQKRWVKYLKYIRHFMPPGQSNGTFKHYTEYYDDESKNFVMHLYKKDIDTFNYEFGET